MKKFNIQFATQKLREGINEVKFTIDDSNLYSAVMDRYMRDTRMPITDEGDYLETDEETFQGVQAIAMDLDKMDALIRLDGIEEMSATGAGANFVPGTGEQLATPKAFKKTDEQKDVEPKLAAGKAKVYMKDKWGWKEAPSIPNRPSKGGFMYKQLFEAFKRNDKLMITRKGRETGPYRIKGVHTYPNGSQLLSIETPKKNQLYLSIGTDGKAKYSTGEEAYIKPLNENYSRFKKETKTRTNEQQLHAAMRLAEKKIHEANRILEYTAQLRGELNETKVNKNTQKLMEKITRGIAEAYGKMKKMK